MDGPQVLGDATSRLSREEMMQKRMEKAQGQTAGSWEYSGTIKRAEEVRRKSCLGDLGQTLLILR